MHTNATPICKQTGCFYGKNDRFLAYFWNKKCYCTDSRCQFPNIFCSCGVTTTNLHYVISPFGWETLLSSKSRFSVPFQCFYGKNDRFLAYFWNKKCYCTDSRCQFPNIFCSCGVTTTNLHYLISPFGWETLLSSKSRFSVPFQCFYGKNDRFLAYFWNKKCYCTDSRCQFPNIFCSCGVTTTNLHYVISPFGWETLLSSKSRFSVPFQCFYGKNDRFLAYFWNKKCYCTDSRCQFPNIFSQWWHNNNPFILCNFTVWIGDFVVFKKPLFCPISVPSWQKCRIYGNRAKLILSVVQCFSTSHPLSTHYRSAHDSMPPTLSTFNTNSEIERSILNNKDLLFLILYTSKLSASDQRTCTS